MCRADDLAACRQEPLWGAGNKQGSCPLPSPAAVGAGVLSLPFAFRAAGWAGCLLATLAVAATEAFTLYVLARYAEVTGSATYSDLVRKMLGRKASAAMSIVLIIYSYGSGGQIKEKAGTAGSGPALVRVGCSSAHGARVLRACAAQQRLQRGATRRCCVQPRRT